MVGPLGTFFSKRGFVNESKSKTPLGRRVNFVFHVDLRNLVLAAATTTHTQLCQARHDL